MNTSASSVPKVSTSEVPSSSKIEEKENGDFIQLSLMDIQEDDPKKLSNTKKPVDYKVKTTIEAEAEVKAKTETLPVSTTIKDLQQEHALASIQSSNKRYDCFSRLRLLIVVLAILPILIFKFVQLDKDSNITSSSSLVNVDDISIPYVIFKASSSKIVVWFYVMQIQDINGTVTADYASNDNYITLLAFYYNDSETLYTYTDGKIQLFSFNYQNSNTYKWTSVYIYPNLSNLQEHYWDSKDLIALMIPPKSLTMDVKSLVKFQIESFSDLIDPGNSVDDQQEYVYKIANTLDHGVLYTVDNTFQLLKSGANCIQDAVNKFANSTALLATAAQDTFVYMEEFEVKDDTDRDKENIYYSLTTGVSFYAFRNSFSGNCLFNNTGDKYVTYNTCNFSSTSVVGITPGLFTNLYLLANPVRIKTVIHWKYIDNWVDVFASVGGLLSPFLTATAVFLVWFTWGRNVGICRFSGMASSAGFTDPIFIRRLDAYMAERGLLMMKEKYEKAFTCQSCNTIC